MTFSFDMGITRIAETPRVTKPYTDAEWERIVAVGHEVDDRLAAGDVRLSMGGEPTFVSIDDMEGDEWNTAAVGPTKRGLADDLVRRLQKRFAPGGLLHYGQGKWYPGEPLPRWAFAVYWRTDGQALWADPSLIARETSPLKPTIADAQRFSDKLCDQLGLPAESTIPAYEDAAHFALIEQKLAVNSMPADNRLADPAERARLIAVLDRGLATPASYVLPIQVWQARASGAPVGDGALGAAPREAVPAAGRFAGRLPAAARLARLPGADRNARGAAPRSLMSRRHRWRSAKCCRSAGAWRHARGRRPRRRARARSTARCEPRWRWSHGGTICASSCRRWRMPRTMQR